MAFSRGSGVAFVVAVAGALAVGAAAEGADEVTGVVPNASFEEAAGAKVAGWSVRTWGGKAKFEHADVGHEGGHSVRVASTDGADAGWGAEVVVRPYSTYRFRAWVKTQDVASKGGQGAVINVYASGRGPTEALTGTKPWTQVERLVETGADDCLNIYCVLGGWGLATGTVWFDDLSLEWVSSKELKPEAAIHAGETGAPISKYIYGQFIEHLGRCIYGGIWAEMLEDRKFFYDVGAKESPWRAFLGTQGASAVNLVLGGELKMVPKQSFVGEHTPWVKLKGNGQPFGISQNGLGLRAGQDYVGRIVLASTAGVEAVEVALVWGAGRDERETLTLHDLAPDYTTYPLRFTARGDAENGSLQIAGRGKGTFGIGTVSLMPADNVHGMRADTLQLLEELDAPIYRWPGGNFVSGYNWRDGLGDRDRRPPRKNPAWIGVEHNDFGLDEFIVFCRTLGTEPLIVVNSGLGQVDEAVAELQYANGGADTPMGKLRAENGHPEAYGVAWWGIGNEMYGDWQLGNMPLEDYVKKHNAFAEAMRAEDPSVKLVAVGATGPWSETMLAQCADHMDLLSEHFYCHEKPGLLSHVRQIPDNVRQKAEAHRRYHREIPALAGKHVPIALDEWNYWYGPQVYGQLGTRYFLKDALGVAAGLHECARHSDVFHMANYAQTVNVIGAVKTTKTAAEFATTGLVLKLYRHHFGTLPVRVEGDTAPLDVMAAWREDRAALTVGVVNATHDAHDLRLGVDGTALTGEGRVWTVTGPDPMAYNEPGVPPKVRIEEHALTGVTNTLQIPAVSVCLFELNVG